MPLVTLRLLLGQVYPHPPPFELHGKVHIANDCRGPPGRKSLVYTIITELHSKFFIVLVVCFKSRRKWLGSTLEAN